MVYSVFYWGWVHSPVSIDPDNRAHWFHGIMIGGEFPIDEVHAWCEENLGPRGKRWTGWDSGFWGIDDAADALAFRLRWC